MKNIIKARNLRKDYGDFTAVKNISFDVVKGEIFGFLGPNGAGKTTTINMLIGMARISGGKIFYSGLDLTKNIKKAQEIIGVVSDESNLYDELSGYENLCFCGALYGLEKSDREKKAGGLLDQFQLSEAADKKFKAYSRGMKRKLAIAAALIHDPEILFLDEPTTGIDVMSARQIRNMIKDLNKNGVTVFLTTHYIEEAERLCDRVAFILAGRIIKIDTVGHLLEAVRENNTVEFVCEKIPSDKKALLKKLEQKFPDLDCAFRDENAIRITGHDRINISPIVNFLSSENIFLLEARVINPTLEDAFVKITGIEIELMKKEKDRN